MVETDGIDIFNTPQSFHRPIPEELQEKLGLTYIFVTHNLLVVKHIADRIAVMYLGHIVELCESEELYKHPLHPYTQALFSAVPVPDPKVKMNRIVLGGDIPSPANPPSGCKFHTRCAYCTERCKNEMPQQIQVGNRLVSCFLYEK